MNLLVALWCLVFTLRGYGCWGEHGRGMGLMSGPGRREGKQGRETKPRSFAVAKGKKKQGEDGKG